MACSNSLMAPSNFSDGSVKMLSIPLVATLPTALSRTIGPKIRCRNDSAHIRAPAIGDAFFATTGCDLPALNTADTCTPRHIYVFEQVAASPRPSSWALPCEQYRKHVTQSTQTDDTSAISSLKAEMRWGIARATYFAIMDRSRMLLSKLSKTANACTIVLQLLRACAILSGPVYQVVASSEAQVTQQQNRKAMR